MRRPLSEGECAAIAAMIHALPWHLIQPMLVPPEDVPRIVAHFLMQMALPVPEAGHIANPHGCATVARSEPQSPGERGITTKAPP